MMVKGWGGGEDLGEDDRGNHIPLTKTKLHNNFRLDQMPC